MMRPILFLDSGIGGLPYCRHFQRRNPGETVVYAADRANFPYGPRERDELAALLVSLVGRLDACFKPKLAALVCNTATVSALAELRERFPHLPFVGTVPAVKPAVTGSRRRHIGVLGTARTIEDPYIGELAARYDPACKVSGIAAPELVEFVEYRHARSGPEERRRAVEPYIAAFREKGADALVLGCTHFLFLLEEFKGAAAPDIRVYDSVEGVSRRIETLLDKGNLRAGPVSGTAAFGIVASADSLPEAVIREGNCLILSGEEAPDGDMIRRARDYGLALRLLSDIEASAGTPGLPQDAP
jgi:glutamate racemase